RPQMRRQTAGDTEADEAAASALDGATERRLQLRPVAATNDEDARTGGDARFEIQSHQGADKAVRPALLRLGSNLAAEWRGNDFSAECENRPRRHSFSAARRTGNRRGLLPFVPSGTHPL